MNEQIIKKIKSLGGNTDAVSADKSFTENWQHIVLNHHLYDKDWDVYGIDRFYETHKELYHNHQEKFYENLLKHYFSDHELPYGQYFFRNWIFTPFKEIHMNNLDGLVEESVCFIPMVIRIISLYACQILIHLIQLTREKSSRKSLKNNLEGKLEK